MRTSQLVAALAIAAVLVLTGCGRDGLHQLESGILSPPDTQVATGPDHVVEAVNTKMRVWSRHSNAVWTLDWPVTTLGPATDPRIRYDVSVGRWYFLVAETSPGAWCFSVSATSDPTGAWTMYRFPFPTAGQFPDQPGLGFSVNKIVLTGDPAQGEALLSGSIIVVLNKADVLAGGNVRMHTFPARANLYLARPSADPYANEGRAYLVGFDSSSGSVGSVRFWHLTGVPGVGTGTALATYDVPLNGPHAQPPRAIQAGTGTQIDTNDFRVLGADYTGSFVSVASHEGCVPAGDTVQRTCLRILDLLPQDPPVGVIRWNDVRVGSAGSYYYYPATSANRFGETVVVFNRSSASELPSIYATGRRLSDPLNTLRPPVLLKRSPVPYLPSTVPGFHARWGDYAGAAVDPVDARSFWVATEYAASLDSFNQWGTWIDLLPANLFPQ
jgi:hypothetical protein